MAAQREQHEEKTEYRYKEEGVKGGSGITATVPAGGLFQFDPGQDQVLAGLPGGLELHA
jgi:hypothetical protein